MAHFRQSIAPGAAPHTRGSTPFGSTTPGSRSGCPAHAGIDPRRRFARSPRPRLPRTRGDRPHVLPSSPETRAAAPHTRGSTLFQPQGARGPHGCPAHAGIDPIGLLCSVPECWLPRTRGDRPNVGFISSTEAMAAPHTRGSTATPTRSSRASTGCPAHAGIDPCTASCVSSSTRLPRTRGDRPAVAAKESPKSAAAPHTRGSTPARDDQARERPGCPAHAGIDPAYRLSLATRN